MSINGVQQLKKVVINFCDFGGSSRGVRSIIDNKQLFSFATQNPQVDFVVMVNRGKHPFIKGEYCLYISLYCMFLIL